MKDFKSPLRINVILQLIAVGISGYLVYHHYALMSPEEGFKSFCSISTTIDCDKVNTSKYSEFLSVPIAVWSLAGIFLNMLLSITAMNNQYSRRDALVLLNTITTFASIVSIALLYASVYDVKAICIMCSGLYVVNFLGSHLAAKAWRQCEFSSGKTATFFSEWKNVSLAKIFTYLGSTLAVLFVLHFSTNAALAPKEASSTERDFFLSSFRTRDAKSVNYGPSPVLGNQNANAPVKILEFADFQCPHCAHAAKQMHHNLQLFGDKIQLVYKSWPLDQNCNPKVKIRMHEYACAAARASICARKLGKFEPYFTKLFENQTAISNETILSFGKDVGMDPAQLKSCMDAPETAAELQSDIEQADLLGIEGTPLFFVNGKKIEGIIDEQKMRWILKELKAL